MAPRQTGQEPPRVLLVHDWLTGMRGGEKCLEVAARHWPQAQLFTLVHRKGAVSEPIERLTIRTSFLNRLPRAARYYRYLLPLMPAAVRSWQPPPADLVLSFSHCVAKAVRPAPGRTGPAPHVCYCFTPMRYAWQMRDAYLTGRLPGWSARLIDRVLDELRAWDRRTASGVDHFIAISRTIQARIRECYDRESAIIYPPVDTDFYCPAPLPREPFYLVVSALAPYKRIDLAIAACQRLNRPLVVIGAGQDARRLAKLAGPGVRLLGWQSDEVIRDHLRRCQALLFPGEEDFGIVPVEAMACGAPVIAYGRGGATETVLPPEHAGTVGPTGLWFSEQTAECLAEAMTRFEARAGAFDPAAGRTRALMFSTRVYADRLFAFVEQARAGTPMRRAA